MLTDEKFLQKLGQKIERLSNEKFRTQMDFSAASNIDSRTIRRIIKCEQNPTIIILRKIANSLGIELHDLINVESEG
jgi:transcriptional regulator with XRE-family HTH domain